MKAAALSFRFRPRASCASSLVVAAIAGSLLSSLAGCDDPKKPQKSTVDAGPQDRTAAENAKLAAAVRAVASTAPSAQKAAATNGPPEGGIFPKGVAQTQAPAGAPAKIELGSEGAEPRIAWKPNEERWKTQGTLTVGIRLGQNSALPTVDFGVAFSVPKTEAPEKPALLLEIKKSSPATQQLGQLPDGAKKEIGLLKGSEIRFERDGSSVANPAIKLGKGASPEVGRVIEGAGEALLFFTVPTPPKPVGEGAFWIAGSREKLGGVDVVLYRLYRVKSITKDKATLSVESHAYAADGDAPITGAPKDLVLGQFQCDGTSEIELAPGDTIAETGKSTLKMGLLFRPANNPQGRGGTSQSITDATFVRGK